MDGKVFVTMKTMIFIRFFISKFVSAQSGYHVLALSEQSSLSMWKKRGEEEEIILLLDYSPSGKETIMVVPFPFADSTSISP